MESMSMIIHVQELTSAARYKGTAILHLQFHALVIHLYLELTSKLKYYKFNMYSHCMHGQVCLQ